jgi:hypothetical protein
MWYITKRLALGLFCLGVFVGSAPAQEYGLDHTDVYQFRKVKDLIKSYIEDAAAVAKDSANEDVSCKKFQSLLAINLDKLSRQYPISGRIHCATVDEIRKNLKLDEDVPTARAASTIVTYKDDRSEISWEFDVVFAQNRQPLFFQWNSEDDGLNKTDKNKRTNGQKSRDDYNHST